jgi:SAM-dependent methyltransferase
MNDETFDRLAPDYDRLRPLDERWWELFDVLVRAGDLRGRRVLEVGCGPGRLAEALAERARARVWAVDASPEMIAVASSRPTTGARFKVARAEALPFKAGWFERAVLRMVVHLLDRAAAFRELARVLEQRGRLVVATHDPAWFDVHYLAGIFPSIPEIDRARFPDAAALEAELLAAGFAPVSVEPFRQEVSVPRVDVLERIRGRAYSTFDLLPPGEYEAGLERAEHELPDPLRYRHEWLVVSADRA